MQLVGSSRLGVLYHAKYHLTLCTIWTKRSPSLRQQLARASEFGGFAPRLWGRSILLYGCVSYEDASATASRGQFIGAY
jgi:hypothetical protein